MWGIVLTKKRKLNFEIFKSVLVYTIVTLVLLFIFQVFLLEPMYRMTVISQVNEIANDINEEIEEHDYKFVSRNFDAEYEKDDFNGYLFGKERETGTCIALYSYIDDMNIDVVGGDPNGCMAFKVHNDTVFNLLHESKNNKEDITYVEGDKMEHHRLSNNTQIISHVAHIRNHDNLFIFIQSGISPLSPTIRTLTFQLLLVAIFMIIATLILVYYLNKRIAKPLSIINENAKALSEGKYDINEKTNVYREAEELNETLSEASVNIKKADKAKRDLIANISHDLRTPLTMITGYGEMMQDIPEENNNENLQVIVDESKRLTNLVNDLLDLSKLHDNIISLNKTSFNLTDLIKQEFQKYEVYVIKEGYKMETFLCDDVYINADKARIEQVLNNFIINAIHYDDENKHIIIREVKDDNTVQVQIEDHGKGISEEDVDKIWDRYFKVDKKHMRTTTGSGLGLSICKEILELHEAKYGVTSKLNEGSIFYFSFPIEK